jgi:PPOX class probable F420-dependent enzyme
MDAFWEFLGDRGTATLATIKKDGRPQLSVVSYASDQAERLIRVSLTDGRAKTRNLRRDPRATVMVHPETYKYAVFDGDAELTPVAQSEDDATVDELVELYRAARGMEHPDWDEYRAAMVADKRLVLRIRVTHAYGMGA